MLINKHFYEGNFENAVLYANKIISLSKRDSDIYLARNVEILSLFLSENFCELNKLIKLCKAQNTNYQADLSYCLFVENFLEGNYEQAVSMVEKILKDKRIDFLNSKKVVVYYLVRLAALKMGNSDLINSSTQEIMKSDIYGRTFFSKTRRI